MTIFTQFANWHDADVHGVVDEELLSHAHIQLHHGKTQVWNRGGLEPAARAVKPDAVVWRGDPLLPVHKQGLKGLGIPIGQPAFVDALVESKSREQQTLFQRIPWVNGPQAAYLLLLMCASTRANFWCDQKTLKSLLPATMTMFGHVCSRSSGCEQLLQSPTCSPPSRSQQGVWVLPVLSVSGLPHIGPVGPIPSA